jgi:hypothetical protein
MEYIKHLQDYRIFSQYYQNLLIIRHSFSWFIVYVNFLYKIFFVEH